MTKPSPSPEVKTPSWFGSLLVAASIVATFIFIGLALAAVWYSVTPKVYESSATVLIEPRSPSPDGDLSESYTISHEKLSRHYELIGKPNIISQALIKYELDELATLRDLPLNDQVRHIQLNLEVKESEETNSQYRLNYRSPNARDAQTALATLVTVYEDYLHEKYRIVGTIHADLMLKMKMKLDRDLGIQIEKVEQVERQIAAGQNDEETQARLKELQTEVEHIRKKLNESKSRLKMEEQEREHYQSNLHKGFKFTTLSPASKGALIWPLLNVFLLAGGGIGALFGLITAGLMIAVQSIRR